MIGTEHKHCMENLFNTLFIFHAFIRQSQEEDYKDGNESDGSVDSGSTSGPNFNYILNMPLWCLTKEKVDELLKQRDQKVFYRSLHRLTSVILTCKTM